jgi:hypothetical protein
VASYEIKGSSGFLSGVSKLLNIRALLDPVYARAARAAVRDFITETPKMTGTTARGWQFPVKLGLSEYRIKNETTTSDKKRSLVEILDKGRGPIYPKNARRLYIPLSNKGRSKPLGAPIPKGLIYGKDYVFAMKAGPAKGKFFIEKINKKTLDMITAESIIEIQKS